MAKRITLVVEIDLDPTPGWGHSPADWVEHIQKVLPQHYNPKVSLRGASPRKPLRDMTMQELGDLRVG